MTVMRMKGRAAAALALLVAFNIAGFAGADRASAEPPVITVDAFKPRALGRTFTGCNMFGEACTAVSHETPADSPPQYASNRDCGFSAQFDSPARGGQNRWLWVYCDTNIFRRQTDGNYRAIWPYYRTNSAGIAQSSIGSTDPRRDRAAASMSITDAPNLPYRNFIDVDPALQCPPNMVPNAWPLSAAVLPDTTGITLEDGVTPADAAVLVTFQSMCSIPGFVYGDVGLALWTWSRTASADPHQAYEPARQHAHGLHARVLTHHLFGSGGDTGFGHAATYTSIGGNNVITMHRCHRFGLATKGCELARVSLTGSWATDQTTVVDPTQWEYSSTQGTWKHFTQPAPGQPGTPPTDAKSMTDTGGDQPADSASVQYSPALKRWVLLGSPNSLGDLVVLRTSTAPWGPWSAGFTFRLPNCTGGCYAPNLHPELDTATGVGLSYVVVEGQTVQRFDGTSRTVQEMRSGTLAVSAVPANLKG